MSKQLLQRIKTFYHNNNETVRRGTKEENKENEDDLKLKILKEIVDYSELSEYKVKQEICIFLSSTFSDFQLERNYIIENIYDKLKEFCRKDFNIGFTLIDLRWGITDEATNQQLGTQICLHEIKKCKKESIGPSFVTFLSHRYGSRLPPTIIDENEFSLMKRETECYEEIQYKKKSMNLLDCCYVLDQNCAENRVFKMKSLDELKSIIDKSDLNKQLNNLMHCMRRGIDNLTSTGEIAQEEKEKYFCSVTDQEIKEGLFNEKEKNLKCFAIIRNLEGLDQLNDTNSSYIETDEIDLLNELKNNVKGQLNETNKCILSVNYTELTNYNQLSEGTRRYLTNFGDYFIETVKRLISKNINELKFTYVCNPEILHHNLFCNKLAKQNTNNNKLTNIIRNYINDDSNNSSFLVHGYSGSGKSTILAHISKEKALRNPNDIMIIRFMGTSRESSTIKSIMNLIIKQLDDIEIMIEHSDKTKDYQLFESVAKIGEKIDIKENLENTLDNIINIKRKFLNKLNAISEGLLEKINGKLIIILDSIDQLSKQDHGLEWMIYDNLPKNVKIIYSIISNFEGIPKKFFHRFKTENCLELLNLDKNTAMLILEQWLTEEKRKLTGSPTDQNTQWFYVDEILSKTKNIYPLHIKILFDIVSKWTSFYKVDIEFKECLTTQDTIKYLFRKIEALNGYTLFSHIVFYLTLFQYNGISEGELEDILSIDDDVLTEVFQYHHPPVRRFQMSLWLTIKYEIRDYLTKKEIDDITVISWFHRSFIEASKETYTKLFTTGRDKDTILFNIIDYFTEKWNEKKSDGKEGQKKGFNCGNKIRTKMPQRFKNEDDDKDKFDFKAYRNTKPQEIIYKNSNNEIIGFNKRKLNELINVIFMLSDDLAKVHLLKEHIYLNYDFMYSKCELGDLDFIIERHEEIEEIRTKSNKSNSEVVNELFTVSQIYKRIYPKIRPDPSTLYKELLSRLDSRSKYVKQFASQFGLLLCQSIKQDLTTDLFVTKSNLIIKRFYLDHMGPFLFIEVVEVFKQKQMTTIEVVHSTSGLWLGSIDLNVNAKSIQVLGNDNNSSLKKLNDFNGFICFAVKHTIYLNDFNQTEAIYELNKNCSFKKLFILNSSHLCVIMDKAILLLGLNKNNFNKYEANVKKDFEIINEIELVESTIEFETVYSSQYLENDVDLITIIVGMNNACLGAYVFNNRTSSMSLVRQINYIKFANLHKFGESILIDSAFKIGNNKIKESKEGFEDELSNSIIRFCVINKAFTSIYIVEIKRTGEYTLLEIECYEDLDFSESTIKNKLYQLEGFINGKLIIKIKKLKKFKNDKDGYNINIFDTVTNKLEKTELNESKFINLIDKSGILLTQYTTNYNNFINLYKIAGDNKIIVFSQLDLKTYGYNKKLEAKIKHNSLLRIDPKSRNKITKFENILLKNKNDENIYDEDMLIQHVFDKNIVLALVTRRDHSLEMALVDLEIGIKKKSWVLQRSWQYNAIKLDNGTDYFAYFDKTKQTLSVYKSFVNEKTADFMEAFHEKLSNFEYYDCGLNRCHFNRINENLTITLYNEVNHTILIQHMKWYEENETPYQNLKSQLETIQMDKIGSVSIVDTRCFLTSIHNYIIIKYQCKLYLIEINNNTLLTSLTTTEPIDNILMLPETNDLLIVVNNCIYYIEIDSKQIKFNHRKLKQFKGCLYLKIEKEFLFVYGEKLENFEIYKLNDIIESKELSNAIVINKSTKDAKITHNSKYLVIGTSLNELVVYKLNNLIDNKDHSIVGSLKLNMNFANLFATTNYISIKLSESSKLMTFLIME